MHKKFSIQTVSHTDDIQVWKIWRPNYIALNFFDYEVSEY